MLRSTWRRAGLVALAVVGLVLVISGCGSSGGGGGSGKTIALLLPENQTARYESHDRPDFQARLKELCSNCKLLYSNATGDATKQQSQADAALTQGAKVLVLDAVDAGAAASIVTKAKAQNVPVVSYDRLITNSPVAYYVSFDNVKVGQLQGQALAGKLKSDGKATGPIVMINGAPTDNN